MFFAAAVSVKIYILFHQEDDGNHRPLRPPPGLSCSSRSQLTNNDDVTDWLHLLLEAGDAQGELIEQPLPWLELVKKTVCCRSNEWAGGFNKTFPDWHQLCQNSTAVSVYRSHDLVAVDNPDVVSSFILELCASAH